MCYVRAVNRQDAQGKTARGEQKETFGTGTAAQSEAGKKGGAISAGDSHEDHVKRGIKAAITKGQQVHQDISPEMAEDLKNEGYEVPKQS